MRMDEFLTGAKDAITARRVYADPIERDGVMIIAAASVTGGGGAGSGSQETGQEGSGGGFGITAKPIGAYVIKDGHVSWRPALDINRLITVLATVTVASLVIKARVPRRAA